MVIREDTEKTPIVTDELLNQYAEAYLVRRPVPYTFIEYVNKLETIRRSNYPYEYVDYLHIQWNY